MQLSKYVTLEEFERSATAERLRLKNKMSAAQTAKAKALCMNALDKIREYYDRPIIITSGYRSPVVNEKIGGAVNPPSQHTLGEAADFYILGVSIQTVFNDIKTGKIPIEYDQLISEGSWIHLSYRVGRNKKQNMIAIFRKGLPTVYKAA